MLNPARPTAVPITVSVKRAADLTGLSRATINRMISTGELSTKLVRNRRLICLASLRTAVTQTELKQEADHEAAAN